MPARPNQITQPLLCRCPMNPVSFSTLACPGWSIEKIIVNAGEFGYDGIEWRGGPQGHVQPTMPAAQKAVLQKMLLDTGLSAVAVTAYTGFVSPLGEERKSNVDELRRYVDLAAELDAPYVRTFLGELPEGTKLDSSMYEQISDCLNTAADYASSVGVKIAVEPHDDFVRSTALVPILTQVQHPALRVIWDIGNAFAAGEDLKEGFELLKNRMAYVQIKDGNGHGNEGASAWNGIMPGTLNWTRRRLLCRPRCVPFGSCGWLPNRSQHDSWQNLSA